MRKKKEKKKKYIIYPNEGGWSVAKKNWWRFLGLNAHICETDPDMCNFKVPGERRKPYVFSSKECSEKILIRLIWKSGHTMYKHKSKLRSEAKHKQENKAYEVPPFGDSK